MELGVTSPRLLQDLIVFFKSPQEFIGIYAA